MEVNSKAMAGVPVVTKSGQDVGKVASFDLDAATGKLMTLRVKTRGLVPGLMNDELVITWSNILEMTAERVTVADASVAQEARAVARATPPRTAPAALSGGVT